MADPLKIPNLLQLTAGVKLEAAVADLNAPRGFEMEAYTGARVSLGFMDLVLEQVGYVAPTTSLPILQQHDPTKIVGLAAPGSAQFVGPTLHVRGKMYKTRAAMEVAQLADDGFPWQASVGVQFMELEFIDEDEERPVNGRCEKGPFILGKKWSINESSFVPLGADGNTRSAVLAPSTETITVRRKTMADPVPMPALQPAPTPTPAAAAVNQLDLERARINAIRTEFADDPSFALERVADGSTIEQAQGAYVKVLRAKLAAQVQTPVPASTAPINIPARLSGGPTNSATPILEYQQLYEAELAACGGNREQAARQLSRKHPQLRERFVEEYNQTHSSRPRA